jgi:hypothetical protein
MACLSGQIGEVKVLWEEGLTFNHAALLFNIYPTDSIALIPAPAPTGYKTKLNKQDSWVEVFHMSLPLCLPYMPPYSTVLVDPSTIRRVLAHKYLELLVKAFDNAIEEACKKMLKLNRLWTHTAQHGGTNSAQWHIFKHKMPKTA